MQASLLLLSVVLGCCTASNGASASASLEYVLSYNVTENSPVNSPIGNVTADVFRKMRVTTGPALSFILLQCANKLAISSAGELLLIEEIDREETPTISCNTAVNRVDGDATKDKLSVPNQLTLLIQVTDVNDEAPRWETSEFEIDFFENAPSQSSQLIPLAMDNDATLSRLTYNKSHSVLANGTRAANDPFQLIVRPNSLSVSLIGRLDYESVPEYRFVVMASDGRHHASLEVKVRVKDINEYPPQFSNSSYVFSLKEDVMAFSTGAFAQIVASDADGTDRDEGLRYSIVPQSATFEVDDNGNLKLLRELNYEQARLHTFTVIARDHGQLSASATVTVSVVDVNDVAPRIIGICKTGLCSSVSVTEDDPPGRTDLKLYVSDEDSGRYGDVHCYLSPDSDLDKFSLLQDGSSKVYLLGTRVRFDREQMASYTVTVLCEDDGGADKKSAEMRVSVHVVDRNDCTPTLSAIEPPAGSSAVVSSRDAVHFIELPENVNVGSILANLKAHDCDEAGSSNSKVNFRLLEEIVVSGQAAHSASSTGRIPSVGGTFSLSSDGTLSLANALDREMISDYQIKVALSDEGSPSLNSSSTIRIRVLDVVDTQPRFLNQSYRFSVRENVASGYTVAHLTVDDPDDETLNALSFQIVQWSVSTPNDCYVRLPFSIDHSGVVRTKSDIDHEACARYVFQVKATDSAGLHAVANVEVSVLDENDNAPQFVFPNSQNNSVRVSLTSADLPIARLSALDADANPDCPLSYSLKQVQSGKADLFYVHERTGDVRMTRQPGAADSGQHRVTVEVSDCDALRHNVTQTLFIVIENDVADTEQTYQAGGAGHGYSSVAQRPSASSAGHGNQENFVLMVCLLSVFGCMIALALIALVVLCKRFAAAPGDEHDAKTRRRMRKRQVRSPRSSDLNNNNEQCSKMMLSAPSSASSVRKSASFARVQLQSSSNNNNNNNNKCDSVLCERENADNELLNVACQGCKLGTCELADSHVDKLLSASDMMSPYSCKTQTEQQSISEYSDETSEKNTAAAALAHGKKLDVPERCTLSHCTINEQDASGTLTSNLMCGNGNRSEIGSPTFSLPMPSRQLAVSESLKKRQLVHTVPRRAFVNTQMQCACPECIMNSAAMSGMQQLPVAMSPDSWLASAPAPASGLLNAPLVLPIATKQMFNAEMMSFVPRAYDTTARPAMRPVAGNSAIAKEHQLLQQQQQQQQQQQLQEIQMTQTRSGSSASEQLLQGRMKSFTKPMDNASYV